MDELTTIETRRRAATTTYHGVDVTDDYTWLEDAASEETQLWTKAQQRRTTSYLTGLPGYADIRRRAEEIIGAASMSYAALTRGGVAFFALKHQPPKQQPFLVALDDIGDASSERVVVDPNEIDSSGATTIDWYVPSPDGLWSPCHCPRTVPRTGRCTCSRCCRARSSTSGSPGSR